MIWRSPLPVRIRRNADRLFLEGALAIGRQADPLALPVVEERLSAVRDKESSATPMAIKPLLTVVKNLAECSLSPTARRFQALRSRQGQAEAVLRAGRKRRKRLARLLSRNNKAQGEQPSGTGSMLRN
jgi:hypothetical protein